MMVICLFFDQSFLMLDEPIPINLVKFIHLVANFLHRLTLSFWIAFLDDVLLVNKQKEQYISLLSQLLQTDLLVVSNELQMRQLLIMNPSYLAVLSAQVYFALLYDFTDKGPELVLLIKQRADYFFIASADLHFLSVQPVQILLIILQTRLPLNHTFLFYIIFLYFLNYLIVMLCTAISPPPPLNLDDRISIQILFSQYEQFFHEYLQVYLGAFLFFIGDKRKIQLRCLNFSEVKIAIPFFQSDYLVIHEHQIGHFVDEEMASFGLLQLIAEQREILQTLALHTLFFTSVTSITLLMVVNLLQCRKRVLSCANCLKAKPWGKLLILLQERSSFMSLVKAFIRQKSLIVVLFQDRMSTFTFQGQRIDQRLPPFFLGELDIFSKVIIISHKGIISFSFREWTSVFDNIFSRFQFVILYINYQYWGWRTTQTSRQSCLAIRGVGKSCLINRYIKGEFTNQYNVTVGVEYASKILAIDDKTTVRLQIWDTAGQELFRAVVRSFYRGISAVYLLYAIDNAKSFQELKCWMREVQEHAHEEVVIFLIGARSDLEERREVSKEEAAVFLKEVNGMFYVETSSKTGENIEFLFKRAAEVLHKKYVVNGSFRNLVRPVLASGSTLRSSSQVMGRTDSQGKGKKCC